MKPELYPGFSNLEVIVDFAKRNGTEGGSVWIEELVEAKKWSGEERQLWVWLWRAKAGCWWKGMWGWCFSLRFYGFLKNGFCIFKGETLENFTCLRREFALVKGKMPLEKELRDGSRWNSNQGLELGADVLWYFFVRVWTESMCEFGGDEENVCVRRGFRRLVWNLKRMGKVWITHVEKGRWTGPENAELTDGWWIIDHWVYLELGFARLVRGK